MMNLWFHRDSASVWILTLGFVGENIGLMAPFQDYYGGQLEQEPLEEDLQE